MSVLAALLVLPLLLQAAPAPAAACVVAGPPDTTLALPAALDEVSGIALAPGGRLLVHDDERGRLSALDPATGRVLQSWPLAGEPAEDFEGITIVGTRVYLLTSAGTLYITGLPAGPGALPFTLQRTGLAGECEFEGLGAEPGGSVLLLGCKTLRRDRRGAGLRILRWDLSRRALASPATIELTVDELKDKTPWKRFQTSALEVSATGNILVLSASQRGLLELSPAGAILRAQQLAREAHRQPEGLALLPGGDLLVSDEAAGHRATLSRYRCR